MVRGFSGRLDPVVASNAALRGAGMVEPADRPLPGCVAGVAFGLSDNVVCGFAVRPHVIVTAGAVTRSSLEDRALVAGFARHNRVRSR